MLPAIAAAEVDFCMQRAHRRQRALPNLATLQSCLLTLAAMRQTSVLKPGQTYMLTSQLASLASPTSLLAAGQDMPACF